MLLMRSSGSCIGSGSTHRRANHHGPIGTKVHCGGFSLVPRHCIAARIKQMRNIAILKLGYPRVSRKLRCGSPPRRGVDRQRLLRSIRRVPDYAEVKPGTRAQCTGMGLGICDGFACDAAALHRSSGASRRFCLCAGVSRGICRAVHRHTLREMGACRKEEEAAAPRRCANRATPAVAVNDVAV